MAIQMRRGEYAKLDASRLLPGEWAVVLSGDSAATDGRSVYVCFAAGATKKLVTVEDFGTLLADAEPEASKAIVDAASAAINAAESARAAAERSRVSSESTRQSNESTRQSNETSRQNAESTRRSNESTRQSNESTRQSNENARATADKNRETRQKANDDAQAKNNQAAMGMSYHVCSSSEYRAGTLHNVPSVTAQSSTVYLTPKLTGATTWCKFDHWLYVGGAWELLNDTSNMASYYYKTKPAESAVPSKPSVVYVSDGSSYIVADDLSASAKAAPFWDDEEDEDAGQVADSKTEADPTTDESEA